MGLFKLAVLGALAATAVLAEEYEYENNVLVLNDENFDAALKEFDPLLVAFVAPWCGHCKKLKPEYSKAAKALKADGLKIAMVDADAHRSLSQKYDISGFPTIKFFKGGKANDYNGGRDKDSIASFVRKRSGPSLVQIASVEDANNFKEKADVTVICFAAAGSDAAKSCENAAGSIDDVPFGITDSNDVRAAFGVAAGATAAVAINKFEGQDNEVAINGDAWITDSDVLGKWATANALPLVITFSQEMAPKIFRGDIKTHFLLFADADDEASKPVLDSFRVTAKANQGALLFVNVPSSEDRVLSYFGFTKDVLPKAIIVNMADGGMKKFPFDGEFTTAAYDAFVAEYQSGNVKPFLKSDPIVPADEQAKNNVKVVVGKSFADLCVDPSKDCLLEVYAPWCGHCKQLAPIYEKLGKAVKKAGLESSLVIAQMDGTTNEIDYPGLNVRGFPTIVFLPAGEDAKVIDFDGSRDLAGFLTFLTKNAKGPKKVNGLEDAIENIEENSSDDDEEL